MSNIDQIKQLREETGASPADIKKALEQSGDDLQKAKDLLRTWGKKVSAKKADREAKSGLIDAYVHQNSKTGVLLDIRCETDFVAKNPEFKELAHEICLQIAAMNPLYVSEDGIPKNVLEEQLENYKKETASSKKPENIVEQIVDGKLKKYKEQVCLFSQPWIKDDSKTIKDLVENAIAKIGEKIEVKSFSRFAI